MPPSSFLHRAAALARRLGLVALVLGAILVTALRLALPLADDYRDQVAGLLSQRLGYPVQVGALSVRLSGLTLRLTLDDVVLQDPRTRAEVLSLRALELDLDPNDSLRLGSPQWSALTLVGARLAVHRLRDGRVQVVGLAALAMDDPRTLELFLSQGRLNLIDSEILLVDDRLDGPLLRLEDLALSVENVGLVHRLALSARPEPADAGARGTAKSEAKLRVQARLHGDPATIGSWGGRLYLSLGGADLATLLPPTLLPAAMSPARVHNNGAQWEGWVSLQDGALTEALSRIRAQGLTLKPSGRVEAGTNAKGPAADGGLVLDRLSALVRMTPADKGWRLEVADLGLSVDGADLGGVGLELGLTPEGRVERLNLGGSGLDLRAAAALARWAGRAAPDPLPAGIARLLTLESSGRIEDLALAVSLPPAAPPRWRAQARGQGLGLARSGRIPGFSGLSAALGANQDGGEIRLGSEGLVLDIKPLFDRPIGLEQFSGLFAWSRAADGALRLTGRNLALENPDLRGRARFALDLPAPGADPDPGPFLDLRASFTDGNGANARPYLPVGIMHKNLIAWLERALVACRVSQADLVLRGPLRHYPFRDQEGVFQLVIEFEDAVLDYLAGWPRIEDATGSLRFQNQGLDILVDSGRLLDSTAIAASASLPDLWAPRRLAIHGEGEGPMSDGLRILAETPLSRQLGPLSHSLEVQGRSHLDLDLSIPLIHGDPLGVDGRVTWPGPAGVALKGTSIAISGLAGDLGFTIDSIRARSIRGQLWGRPVDMSIATRNPGDPESATTAIRARTRISVKELTARAPSPAWRLASGDLNLDLRVDLRNADLKQTSLPLVIGLRSDLRGLALDLPPPLGKPANRAGKLDLRADLVPGRRLGLSGGLDPLAIDLDLDLDRKPGAPGARLERGRVHLGGEPAAPPDAPGLAVDGSLKELDLPAWSDWWERVQGDIKGLAPAASADASAPGLRSVDLHIGRLDLGGPTLTQAHVRAEPLNGRKPGGGAGGWILHAESQELAGRLTLPPPGRGLPIDLGLARLDLKALLPSEANGDDADPGARTAARKDRDGSLPALDLRVDALRWGEGNLGRLTLKIAPDELGTRVSGIDFQGAGKTAVKGDAAWIDGENGGRGRLSLSLSSADPGPLLRVLDSANAVSQAPLESTLSLQWPGNLQDFALADSTGSIAFKLGAGSLPKVEPGVGRVLGFLNLGALSRRLTLDFRDIYEQGFSFERIAGQIRVGDGRATVQSFDIEGPASRIQVSGYSNLRTRTFDQTVTVEPSIGTSVAIAGAVAGGPAVGAAVFAINRLSGGAIDRLGSFQYRVTGPWKDPVLQPVGWEPFAQAQTALPPAGGRTTDPREDKGGGTGRYPKDPADSPEKGRNPFLD